MWGSLAAALHGFLFLLMFCPARDGCFTRTCTSFLRGEFGGACRPAFRTSHLPQCNSMRILLFVHRLRIC